MADMVANLLAKWHATNVRVVTFGFQKAKTKQCPGRASVCLFKGPFVYVHNSKTVFYEASLKLATFRKTSAATLLVYVCKPF